MGAIVVVGSINMDLVIHSPRFPSPGETVIGHGFMTAPGGKGANQACAAAKLGGEVRLLARVGNDAFGSELIQHLSATGVNTADVIAVDDSPSGVALITVREGENTIVIDPGANHRLTTADVAAYRRQLAAADLVVLQLEIPLEVVAETVRVAGEVGTPVLLNPAPAVSLGAETLAGVSYLTPNAGEAATLTGRPHPDAPLSADELERIVGELRRMGVSRVCATLGGDGVAYTQEDGTVVRRPAYPVTPFDTTAAGDVFSGALAVALTENLPLDEAVDFAQRAAAISVTRGGAGPSIPLRSEVDRFEG